MEFVEKQLMKRKAAIIGISSTKLKKSERYILKKFKPWGVILFSRNIKNLIQLKSLIKDINCFLRTYSYIEPNENTKSSLALIEDNINCPLVSLGLITGKDGIYRWRIGRHTNLPTEIFGYGLYKFKELVYKNEIEIKLDQLRFGKFSPGKIFGLSNVEIHNYIQQLRFGDLARGRARKQCARSRAPS